MKKSTGLSAVILCFVLLLACVACSSGRGSASQGSESAQPKDLVTLHFDISYESNLFLAKYDVEVKVDDTTVATLAQGDQLQQEGSFEKGKHVITFCEKGKSSALATSQFDLQEESYYQCSLKAHTSEIEIIGESFESAAARSQRVADEKAAAEKEEAERKAKEEQEERERKAAEEAHEQARQTVESCKDETAIEALEAVNSLGVSVAFYDGDGNEVTSDVQDESLRSVAESLKVSEASLEDDKATFKLDGRFVLTSANNAELANILQLKDPADPSVAEFAEKYSGKTIEFDGCVRSVQNHENYSTRYDILISPDDFNPDSIVGPNFQYRDVAVTSLKWDGEQPDALREGMNLHFVAQVDKYNENSELFILKPVTLRMR